MTNNPQRQVSARRIRYWGRLYLDSTLDSDRRAGQFFSEGDFFTAYLYLFVVFNNLYCLVARFDGAEPAKIRAALDEVGADEIDRVYTEDYVGLINSLNTGAPEQFVRGPDAGAHVQGITNMRDYFLGKDRIDCVAHVNTVAPAGASTEVKRRTLQEVASRLLYTVRNNQFHAVKHPRRQADLLTLRTAYRILRPIVDALMPVAQNIVPNRVGRTTQR